jgi:hypothetical protein
LTQKVPGNENLKSSGNIAYAGVDPRFQVRGGGTLNKIVPSRGRREHFWGISCEKSYFFPILGGACAG